MNGQSRFLDALPLKHVRELGRRTTLSARGASSLAMRARVGSVTTSTAPAKPNGFSQPSRTWSASERVFHAKFGEGVIAEVTDRRDDQELAIDFARHGRKRFMASLTPLDLIHD